MNNITEKESESAIKRKNSLGCLHYLLILLCLISYSIYYLGFKKTLISEHPSPNGERTLSIYEKDFSPGLLERADTDSKTYIIKTENGVKYTFYSLLVEGDERVPLVTWDNDDKACIRYPTKTGRGNLGYNAPDKFKAGCLSL